MPAIRASALRLAIVIAALAPLPASAQFAILYTWPGAFPCNGTLQACIDAAGPEDTVEIASNGPIAETIQATGSVDLVAAPGFTPVFAAGSSVGVSALGSGDTFVRIKGLTLTEGRIIVGNVGTGAQTIQILDNTILAFQVFSTITVSSASTGPIVFRIEGNDLSPSVGADSAIRVFVQNGFGMGDVADNIARMAPDDGATGILLEVEDGALVVDTVRNRVGGSGFGWGIRHRLFDAAVLDARVLGNEVQGGSGGGAGISVEGFTSDDVLDALIVNNTLSANSTGIEVLGVDALVANNVVAFGGTGLEVSSSGVSNRHNLFFGNLGADVTGTAAGPGSVFEDPEFVGPGVLRPVAGSPAIDAGDSSAVPPELATDLLGAPRIQGAAVDIGAFEAPEPSAALAGLAALLGLGLLARATHR